MVQIGSDHPTPLFLFSLPRAGSTLMQKMLGADDNVATLSEPWLLLPLFYALRTNGICTEYSQALCHQAIGDFIDALPHKRADYEAAIRHFTLDLYAAANTKNAKYFLDKTPRYSLIVDGILRTFPEAKCIVLWRNPLAVVASIQSTWGLKRKWVAHRFYVDLYEGLARLLEAVQKWPSRFIQIQYEDVVRTPVPTMEKVFSELGLSFEEDLLNHYKDVRWAGRMGDPAGVNSLPGVTASRADMWPQAFDTGARRQWARHYLKWIGQERLQLMGYDIDQLLRELESGGLSGPLVCLRDYCSIAVGAVHGPSDLGGIRRRIRVLQSKRRCYSLS